MLWNSRVQKQLKRDKKANRDQGKAYKLAKKWHFIQITRRDFDKRAGFAKHFKRLSWSKQLLILLWPNNNPASISAEDNPRNLANNLLYNRFPDRKIPKHQTISIQLTLGFNQNSRLRGAVLPKRGYNPKKNHEEFITGHEIWVR